MHVINYENELQQMNNAELISGRSLTFSVHKYFAIGLMLVYVMPLFSPPNLALVLHVLLTPD